MEVTVFKMSSILGHMSYGFDLYLTSKQPIACQGNKIYAIGQCPDRLLNMKLFHIALVREYSKYEFRAKKNKSRQLKLNEHI